jgi:enoyl-[acyl-carrier protein] reductase/trans-2-enoyl-CoA reductase (NAD+)
VIVRPSIRNNICLTAHPEGCALQVAGQIARTRDRGAFRGPSAALVVGGTNGYGLAARIAAAFGAGARTVSVGYERPGRAGNGGKERTGTAGWYNDRAFLREARGAGLEAESLNADAFLPEVKERAADLVRRGGGADLVVYSIAAPRRADPATGELYTTAIKPAGGPFTAPVLDFQTGEVGESTVPPATGKEIRNTVKVMGGEDWLLWIRALL